MLLIAVFKAQRFDYLLHCMIKFLRYNDGTWGIKNEKLRRPTQTGVQNYFTDTLSSKFVELLAKDSTCSIFFDSSYVTVLECRNELPAYSYAIMYHLINLNAYEHRLAQAKIIKQSCKHCSK